MKRDEVSDKTPAERLAEALWPASGSASIQSTAVQRAIAAGWMDEALALERGWAPAERVGELEDALLVITQGRMCFKVTATAPPSAWCRNRDGMSRQAEYGAERWCGACVAHDALGTPPPKPPDPHKDIARELRDAVWLESGAVAFPEDEYDDRLIAAVRRILTADEARAIAGRITEEGT